MRPRSGSAEITDQAPPLPVRGCEFTAHGSGSQSHSCLPDLASKARTAPVGTSMAWLSPEEEPRITALPTTVGGEVNSYQVGSLRFSPAVKSTVPFLPKSEQTEPLLASTAINLRSRVATKTRWEHLPLLVDECQSATPREVTILMVELRLTTGSKDQRLCPVAASRAKISSKGVSRYRSPFQ